MLEIKGLATGQGRSKFLQAYQSNKRYEAVALVRRTQMGKRTCG